MEEEITVSGTVEQVTPWKSNKGSWVNFKDNPNDFFAFAAKCPKVGDTATWQVKEGSGIMADKVELVKTVKVDGQKPEEAEKPLQAAETGKKVYLTAKEANDTVQNYIIKQCCLKAAAEVVGHTVERSEKPPLKGLQEAVIDMADKFFLYITQIEALPESQEDPPDEPEPGE